MKIAIFHDYIDTIGGGEKLILTLARELGADVITTDKNNDAIKNMEFEDVNIISLGYTVKLPPLKQISASIKFAMCDFTGKYDFFIFSGNWAHFAAKKHKPNMFYCQSAPVRPFYDLYDDFVQRQSFFSSLLFRIWVKLYKGLYEYYMTHVCAIIANSVSTQKRMKKYLNRASKVMYPPIDISKFRFEEYGGFWLSVNRLYPEKRVELQIEAFRSIPDKKLIIVGDFAEGDHSSEYVGKIKSDLPRNVELRSKISEEELIDLYSRCRGFIATAIGEDFGMTLVEAMASGKPVVCTREGGYLETVISGKTGIFVEPEISEIVNAVNMVSENPEKFKEDCIKRSKDFDSNIFLEQMKKEIFSKR